MSFEVQTCTIYLAAAKLYNDTLADRRTRISGKLYSHALIAQTDRASAS